MITKGVASVRSPVRNLVEFSSEFGHDSFVNSVVTSFQESYGIREEVSVLKILRGQTDHTNYCPSG
jgi:lipoate-protein ligase A